MRSMNWLRATTVLGVFGSALTGVACGPREDCNDLGTCGPYDGAGASSSSGPGTGGQSGTGGEGGGGGPPAGCIPSEASGPVEDTCGVFVSSSMGDDGNAGSKAKLFKTIKARL